MKYLIFLAIVVSVIQTEYLHLKENTIEFTLNPNSMIEIVPEL